MIIYKEVVRKLKLSNNTNGKMLRLRKSFFSFLFFFLSAFHVNISLFAQTPNDITRDSFEETAGRGLVIRTNPQNVKVFINGVDRGLTPLTINNLISGEYQIKLTREGYKDRIFNAVLFNGSRLVVLIKMEEQRGLAKISVARVTESQDMPAFNPQLFAGSSGENVLTVENSGIFEAIVSLPLGLNTIRVRAFGWEETAVNVIAQENVTVTAEIIMKPLSFKMENLSQSRKRFNPYNPGNLGVTECRFEVSSFGNGTVSVLDKNGSVVYKKDLERFSSRFQHFTWNGTNNDGEILPEGIYTILIESSGHGASETFFLKAETEINHDVNIFPLSLESGTSGLALSPSPHVLPAGSYQLNAGVLLYSEEGAFGLPFKIGIRVSPYKKIELTAALDVNPDNNDKTGWGVTGSVKYNFLNGQTAIPVALSAGAFYTWASKTGEYPLEPGKGAGFFIPLSYELSDVMAGNLSFIVCPSLFWRGQEEQTPELHFGAGILYRGNHFNSGISARCETDFTQKKIEPKYLAGAEVNFMPTPSNFTVFLQGGIWMHKADNFKINSYGGLGIGFVY